jgi:hypothetical protein
MEARMNIKTTILAAVFALGSLGLSAAQAQSVIKTAKISKDGTVTAGGDWVSGVVMESYAKYSIYFKGNSPGASACRATTEELSPSSRRPYIPSLRDDSADTTGYKKLPPSGDGKPVIVVFRSDTEGVPAGDIYTAPPMLDFTLECTTSS